MTDVSGARQQVQDWMSDYRTNSVRFVQEVLGVQPQPWQIEVLKQYDARCRRISIRSGHGVGKSTVLAWLMVHHQLFYFPQKTVVTAPTAQQLWDALWAEYRRWVNELPEAIRPVLEMKADRCEYVPAPEASFVSARTSRSEQPEALQGVHSDWVLLIGDEASGIPEAVFEAAAGSMSGHNAITVLAGNPVRGQGFFFDTHGKLAGDGTNGTWWTRKVPCSESPYVTSDFAPDMARRYGEHSNAYRVRVLGEFPVSDDDTIIPFELVESAFDRDIVVSKTAAVIWGVDCARFGNDRSTLAKRQTRHLMEPILIWHKLDTMELAGRVKKEWDETPQFLRPLQINVDAIGIGAGVADRLFELGLPARAINVSEVPSAQNGDKYDRLRTELWFKMKEWFAGRDVKLPTFYKSNRDKDRDDLVEELTKPKFKFLPGSNKIKAESKDEMKKRGMISPDLADAFALTFASDALTLQLGRAGQTSWRTKLSRPLKGIV